MSFSLFCVWRVKNPRFYIQKLYLRILSMYLVCYLVCYVKFIEESGKNIFRLRLFGLNMVKMAFEVFITFHAPNYCYLKGHLITFHLCPKEINSVDIEQSYVFKIWFLKIIIFWTTLTWAWLPLEKQKKTGRVISANETAGQF